MRGCGRLFLMALCALAVGAGASPGAAAGLRAVGCDLKGAGGPIPEVSYRQLTAALLYIHPDIVVLHNTRDGGAPGESAIGSLGRALGMYYAFEPSIRGGSVGSAVLSRYPISSSGPLSRPGEGTPVPGVRAEVRVGRKVLSVLGVRPGSEAEAKAAAEAVANVVKTDQKGRWLVMATFDSPTATKTVAAWAAAGLQDAATAPGGKAEPTFRASTPTSRLDFILTSGNLRSGLRGTRVVRERRLQNLGEHLPIEVTVTP